MFRQCEGKDSIKTITSTYQANSEKARIVTVYSCQMHLCCTSLVLHICLKGPLFLLNLNALTRFLRLQRIEWDNVETRE